MKKLTNCWWLLTRCLLTAGAIIGLSYPASAVVRYRLPIAANTTTHYYYDHNTSSGVKDFKCGTESYDGHRGSDFSGGPRGKSILAAHQGTVMSKLDGYGDGYIGSSAGGGAGNYVKLNHGEGMTTVCMHMNKGSVTTKGIGASVSCGEKIGGVGTSGNSSGLHLHFDTRLNEVKSDPYAGCAGGPVSWWTSQSYNSETVSTGCQNASPAAPSGLAASTASASQINLSWTDNSGNESGFKIERGNGSSWSQIATVGANVRSYASTGLASGTKYYYRVRAYNSNGNSGYSNTATATTKDVLPAAPSALTATAVSDVQINLAWTDNSGNEDGFRVYRSTDGTNFTQLATVGINVKTYSNTALAGNRKYYYKVCAFNTAGNSGFTAVANDTTAPQAPTTLVVNTVSGTTNWNKLALTWKDNSSAEVGFKVERSTDNATFSQIGTTSVGSTNYTDSGLAATTTYYYRVRSYNANGNSTYSNTASRQTPNAPPVLASIGNKTVAAGSALAFTATATDPNKTVSTPWTATWEGNTHGQMEIMFNKPANSASTSSFIDTAATNYSMVVTGAPSGVGGTKALKAGWTFKTGQTDYWVRYNTYTAPSFPNPTIALDQVVKFRLYSTKKLKVGVGIRETATTAAYGANGGTTGDLEWAAVTNVLAGSKPLPNRSVNTNTWTTLTFNLPFEPQAAFTGNGVIDQSGAKGVLDHIILKGDGGTGAYVTYLDDLSVVLQNTLTYSLEAGAPAGATIERKTGKFAWTPTTAQVGVFSIGVRVTDQLGAIDNEVIKVTVTGTGNAAPVLAAIGNKTVNEGSALSFTASASDANAGQTLAYSLDAGAPAGASINSTSGAFTWTPSEAQGPGSYPITIRVTDNGSPVSNDWETITVTVNEVNAAPVLAAIADQTVTEGSTLSCTASATDADVPVNTLTYSLLNAPAGMSINAASGAISWTPGETDGPDFIQVTVKVADNGSPSLYSTRSFNITVNEANVAPVLTVGSAFTKTETFADFENFEDSFSSTTMFRHPLFSSSTTNYVESTTNYTTCVASFPEGNLSARALQAYWSFKSGVTNPWLRLTTYNGAGGTYYIPNPTIDITKRLRFDVWTAKSIKLALGVRETGTSAAIGMDGGYTGTIEWVGATANGTTPVPTRTISASNWTTVEFDFPAEVITAFPASGDGVLSSPTGKAVLEHLAIVPNAGSGAYEIYLDNFQVVSVSSNLVVNTGETITLTNSAVDADLDSQGVKDSLTFSLDAGAPAGAEIDPDTGVFTWTPTPAQSPSTNVIAVRVTDSGIPALSDVENITIIVNKANTAPIIGATSDLTFVPSGELVEYQATAIDNDVPADTLTYSLVGTVPPGATIDPVSGAFTWQPPLGNSTNVITIRVTDNGVPPLFDEMDLTVIIGPTNTAPVINLGVARATEPVVTFETFTNNTPNEAVMFKKPANSTTTSAFVDTAATNYTTVTTSFPAGNSRAGSKVLKTAWTFKTGTTNYWVRLTTYNTTYVPNPTINASARLKFDVYTDKSLKVGVGIRETGTTAENGANGGTTGTIEYVGCATSIGSTPQPTRTVSAGAWTTLEFDLPNEPMQTLTGDSILSLGQQVLEHLILVGNGGTGAYTVYLDNFEVVTTTSLPGTVNMKANSTLTLTATSTDVENDARSYSLEEGAPTGATINATTGAFTWTPDSSSVGTTNELTIVVKDAPVSGAPAKQDSETFIVNVAADSLGAKSGPSNFIAGGDSVAISWDSVPGVAYKVQFKAMTARNWTDLETVTADSTVTEVSITNEAGDAIYRVVEVNSQQDE